jgi:transmembrane sensor
MSYQDEGIRRMRFSGTINKHRPLDEILNFLEKTTNIHFEVVGKSVRVMRL